ncbi:ribonucleoprotein PTB-binding 2 [Rhinophrynus dorsalis]
MAAQDTGLPLTSPDLRAYTPTAYYGGHGDAPGNTAILQSESRGGKAAAVPRLGAKEVLRRLKETRSELGNRRKIVIRNLPQDCVSQDIYDLLKDYEVKYCYVDTNKNTAFITLLNGDQAQDVIQRFHQYTFRDKDLFVQLQPTDALLCITNLPPLYTLKEFEELVRAYGNIERCFLVYNELTGISKGYGFVEYMKKDSASRAKFELLGKHLEEYTLFAQWMDVNQLTAELIHSKCLCVDKLPKDYSDSEELTQLFSSLHKPLFCQLAEDEGGNFGGFAVVEYERAEQAEVVRSTMEGTTIKGNKIQVSFCAPGSTGRSTLTALIAAQAMNNKKGLLPEPDPVQIMKSLNNPALLQMLLQRPQRGKHGSSSGQLPFINTMVSQALLQLNKLHQNPGLGSNALLQNFSHLQMTQQQILQLKSAQSNNCKPGLLGEAPVGMLQTAVGGTQPGSVDASQRDAQKGLMPFYHNQHMGSAMSRLTQEQQSAPGTLSEGVGSPAYLQQSGSMLTGQTHPQNQSANAEASLVKSSNQTSLLGEPPKDIRLSTNPYLNLASVLPGTSQTGMSSRGLQQHGLDGSASQESMSQPAMDGYFNYSQQYGDYSQEAVQQWYDQYAAYSSAQAEHQTEKQEDQRTTEPYQTGADGENYYYQSSSTLGYSDYSAYVQAPPTYYANAQGLQTDSTVSPEKTSTNEKRTYLAATDSSTAGYVEKNNQGTGEHYSDSYFKRKKVY